MSDRAKTLTVDDLIARLTKFPSDTKIYISRDEEGNGYGSIGFESFEYGRLDKSIVIYPIVEHLEYDEVFPLQYEQDWAD